jgi:hypothetical protein
MVGGEEIGGPGPVVGQPEPALAGGVDEAAGDVQDPVAQVAGLRDSEVAVERKSLGSHDEVVGREHHLH